MTSNPPQPMTLPMTFARRSTAAPSRAGRAFLAALAATAALAAIGGCASEPRGALLTYETTPLGATVYENGVALGVAPVTKAYPPVAGSADIRTPDVTAVWPSGAKSQPFFTILHVGDDRVATLVRPINAPNLAMDQANADKVAASNAADAQRRKDDAMRDLARMSGRCQAQMSGTGVKGAIDDCK